MTWGDDLAAWWVEEVAGDPAYREEIVPLALETIRPSAGERWLDLGCGEGRMMRALQAEGAGVIGCDGSFRLARQAARAGPAVLARLPDLGWLRDDSFDGAYAVLVVEHLEDADPLFSECARVVRPGGALAVIVNHPVITAVGSAPVVDPQDGEIMWRWGDYFGGGSTAEPAGDARIEFHHRSTAAYLNAAAGAGWALEHVEERPASERQAERDPLLALQRDIPRVLAIRWFLPA